MYYSFAIKDFFMTTINNVIYMYASLYTCKLMVTI